MVAHLQAILSTLFLCQDLFPMNTLLVRSGFNARQYRYPGLSVWPCADESASISSSSAAHLGTCPPRTQPWQRSENQGKDKQYCVPYNNTSLIRTQIIRICFFRCPTCTILSCLSSEPPMGGWSQLDGLPSDRCDAISPRGALPLSWARHDGKPVSESVKG